MLTEHFMFVIILSPIPAMLICKGFVRFTLMQFLFTAISLCISDDALNAVGTLSRKGTVPM